MIVSILQSFTATHDMALPLVPHCSVGPREVELRVSKRIC